MQKKSRNMDDSSSGICLYLEGQLYPTFEQCDLIFRIDIQTLGFGRDEYRLTLRYAYPVVLVVTELRRPFGANHDDK